jgi:uncharacterized repeat protein (TIGR01451 family)
MFSRAPKYVVLRPAHRRLLAVIMVSLLVLQPLLFFTPTVDAASGGSGSISLTTIGVAYTQNFNTLTNTPDAALSSVLPTGWLLDESGTSARNDGQYAVGTGSSATGDIYAYGTPVGNADRALGELRSGTLVPILGASFTNNTGTSITSLDVSYTGEQWRSGDNTTATQDKLNFQYSTTASSIASGTYTSVTALDFSGPQPTAATGALNGNLAANRTVIVGSISGLNIPNGATFFIRWTDTDITGSDDGLAVDDFNITPRHVNQPTNPEITTQLATPASVSPGGTTLLTATVQPGADPTSTGITVTGDLSSIGGSATQTFFDNATNGDAVAGDNIFSFNATVSNATTPGAKSLPVVPRDAQSRTGATKFISLTVSPPQLKIHDIQGSGTSSSFNGLQVSTTGIVTGIKTGSGFFIQEPDATVDANPNTSEGVFVFTGSSIPAAAVIGNSVSVTGTVQEFIPSQDVNSPPVTEIAGSPTVSVLSTGNSLPAAITLTAADTSPSGAIEQLERFEGMRVHVDSLDVVAPTQGNISEANATSTSTGIFYGVITGIARPFREPGIEVPDPFPTPTPNPNNIPRFDANPERLRVDSDAQPGTTAINVTAGATVTNITGPVDYSFRTYTILPDAATPPAFSGNVSATPVPVPGAGEFTVASFNTERFYDTVNDPSTSDVVLTATALNNRLNKASLAIRNVMRTPDIIGIEEMENLTNLQALANKVNNDAVAAGDPNPNYQAYLVEGNDIGGIDVGFLVKTPRVNVISVTQEGKTATYINPNNGLPELLNDRPSLVLVATIQPPSGSPYPVTVIVNHLRSLSGVDDPVDGNRVRTKRRAQAEFLANLIQARQVADPNEHIISVGDYNAFQFNDGYVDSIGTIKGTPTAADQVALASGDLVNPDLIDLVDMAPAAQRYSFSFDGNAQELDHILITGNLLPRFNALNYARNNADFPEVFRNDATRPERISDHDMPVAYFSFPTADLSIGKTGSPDPVLSGGQLTYAIPVHNGMADPAMNLAVNDQLPANTTFQSLTAPAGWSCSTPAVGGTGTISCSASSLAPDTTAMFTLVVAVDCAVADSATISNTATVSTSTFDPDQSNNTTTATVTVSNPAPVVMAPDDASYQCASDVPVGDASQATVSDNCGTPAVSFSETNNGGAGSPTSPLIISRTWTATDSAGDSSSDSQTITVIDNTAPIITLNGDDPMTVECHTSFTDPGATASDNCSGNLTSQITVQGSVNANVPGTYTLTYSVTDVAGNMANKNRTVNVVDTEPPVLTLLGDNPLTIECHTVFSDPGATAVDACDGDIGSSIVRTGSVNADAVGTYYLTYTVSDRAGHQVQATRQVNVVNEDPVVSITGPASGAIYSIGTPVTFTGNFTDATPAPHTATWTFDSITQAGTVNESTGDVNATYTFTTAGVYLVTLKVTDACGGVGTANTVDDLTALVVIYDPTAGFVTGGGWIDSPLGAYKPSPTLTGKANFGFVSKYQNGANAPTGQTEFQFKAGNLNFRSTAYEWLVIAGAKAQYKGTGTINGSGDYAFILTATDGQISGGGGVDRIRMKIWDRNAGETNGVIYDNQMGAGINDNPVTALGGGSIVIHK